MRIPLLDTFRQTGPVRSLNLWARVDERKLALVGLAAIVLLAAALRLANLDALGYANHYYSAAVKSMLQSWHNFYFAAAEPGGSVSVDKPPLGLWFQVASAYFFGLSGFTVVLPQILAGILSVILVYYLVGRQFGRAAGLLAALALAVTPVTVAVDRNNTMDSTLILTLLLAAWAFMRAAETGRLGYLALGAGLVGVGFNIKMLEAFLPLPAFYALYLLGARDGFWRKVGKLVLASLVLVIISFSWAVSVDLTPSSQRPYVGSSGDNSVLSLVFGYNGMSRLLGMGPGGAGGRGPTLARPGNPPVPPQVGGQARPALPPGANPGGFPLPGGTGSSRQFNPPGGPGGFQGGSRGGPAGGMDTGQPGLLRLFQSPLNKEASWLLPLALLGLGLLAWRSRLAWPLSPPHQAAVLWGGWLLTAGVFFSVARFFHPYYLAILAPPAAALVGIAGYELWQLYQERPWLASVLLAAAAGLTLALQLYTAHAFTGLAAWMLWAAALYGAGLLLFLSAARSRPVVLAGGACLLVGLLLVPGAWSVLTSLNASNNQSLPAAYDGRSNGPLNRGGLQVNLALLDYLQANTRDSQYLVAVPSSMQGADYVLATGRPVLYLGGFNGQDQVVSPADLDRLVSERKLRFIYWNTPGDGPGGPGMGMRGEVSTWVGQHCTPVQGFDTTSINAGPPDGTRSGDASQALPGRDGMSVSLFSCGS